MAKKWIAVLLTVCLLAGTVVSAGAYTQKQYQIAEALNKLGLFLGDGTGYSLDNLLGRDDGTTLLVRMLGKEAAAQAGGDHGMPFTDVPAWAKGYVGYAWKNGITNGMSATRFGADEDMTDYMFLTLTLRALNYSDSGENARFVWNNPYPLAKEIGLIDTTLPDGNFTRGEAISVFWNALNCKLNGSEETLAEHLISQGVFTAEEFAQATGTSQENVQGEIVTQKPGSTGSSGGDGNVGSEIFDR